jgi:hypothetical protein
MTLNQYKDFRIEALEAEVSRLKKEQDRLTTFIFEMLDDDCPKEYKNVVAGEVFKDNKTIINYITTKK